MAKYKIEWSAEARLDLIDILEFYIIRNKSALLSLFLTVSDLIRDNLKRSMGHRCQVSLARIYWSLFH